MYTFITFYNGLEEGDDSPTFIMVLQQSHMCCIYIITLSGIIDNGSFQRTKSQIYMNGILTPNNVYKDIPMY